MISPLGCECQTLGSLVVNLCTTRFSIKQDRQRTNVTLRRVPVTIAAEEKQYVLHNLSVCVRACVCVYV